MERTIGSQSFDRCDRVTLMHDGKGQARIDSDPVNVDGAGAALTVVASLLGTRQVQTFAQRVQQRHSRFYFKLILAAIDLQPDRFFWMHQLSVVDLSRGSNLGF